MINLIFTIIFTIFSFTSFCQNVESLTTYTTSDLRNNNYIKDIDGILDPYVGTWQWVSGNSEFTVVLVVKENEDFGRYSMDILLGGYKYIENGIEIVNTLNFTTNLDYNNPITYATFAPIVGGIINESPFRSLNLEVSDKIKLKTCNGSFEVTSWVLVPIGEPMQALEAEWKIWNREGIRVNPTTPAPDPDFSIPEDVVFTKIN